MTITHWRKDMDRTVTIQFFAHVESEAREEMEIFLRLGWNVTLQGNAHDGYCVTAQKQREVQ